MTENFKSWANSIPANTNSLYACDYEKDACGVGFIVNIKGNPSHKILSDARSILCNMTHRGATGADANDGDGAGVMTGIPHEFFKTECDCLHINLPESSLYATGNIFFHNEIYEQQKLVFEEIALSLELKVIGWRTVPVDNEILGPVAKSKEPHISQPFVIMPNNVNSIRFQRQLYLLRKISTKEINITNWFYVCSLSTTNLVYKGQLSPNQLYEYFLDLGSSKYRTHFALVHSRFSTNTFPSWDRAQPMRFCAHNGEINTLRGNKNWMRSREGVMSSELFGSDLEKLYPIVEEGGSDSAAFDNVLELLLINEKLSLPEIVMMMVPEAWQNNEAMDPKKKAFYQWASCLMEPWDGPALFTFSDGRYCGASLDRNGLRPCRYYITSDDRMICASEVGTVNIDPKLIKVKGRLKPGRILLVDTLEGHLVDDHALKSKVAQRENFLEWIKSNLKNFEDIHRINLRNNYISQYAPNSTLIKDNPLMNVFGFNLEQLNLLILPMIKEGKEALGSMGNDAPLSCLSTQPRSIYDYFKQLFAQVTNPPIDPIRESIVMSLESYLGNQGNILEIGPQQCKKLKLESPILTIEQMFTLRSLKRHIHDWNVATLSTTFSKDAGPSGYKAAINQICAEAVKAIKNSVNVIILSDLDTDENLVPVSSLVAVGAVHQYLLVRKLRSRVSLVVESCEAREVHHFCVLLGYGADAICPFLAIDSMLKVRREGIIDYSIKGKDLVTNYLKAVNNGILKVMSKMGISTLLSYKGAQIFEALGIGKEVIDKCFSGTASRINGIDFDIIAKDALRLHEVAYPMRSYSNYNNVPENGEYHWRMGGEKHLNEPSSIANLQDSVRRKNHDSYMKYSDDCKQSIKHCTLRGLFEFDYTKRQPVSIDEVEPWTNIVKRFCTGAMSYGSISYESHSALAAAMNKIGGKSNTGEGGEDPERANEKLDGVSLRSAIKQIASGRFGVTSYYLSQADELQIKMAQGAKPGEGGELPGHKVSEGIAKTRKSTPGVGLISPPPHHDIYSIEDLKQLIYDLKCSNPRSRVSVKLVSEVGVGIVASGVAKARADHILISGHDGGTGASRWTGIKNAGLPWELGLAETHQTLVLNNLRNRVVIQTDGQIKTGRDVVMACLLGAEEWGFATAPLIAMGCIMMRKCHLNTCPVGIATQDPYLRKKFEGQPEHVINFFYFIAEEVRSIMSQLGFKKIEDMVGRTDVIKLDVPKSQKLKSLDLSSLLTPAHQLRTDAGTYCVKKQDHKLYLRLDNKLIEESELALKYKQKVVLETKITNTDRALGSTLSYHVSKNHGENGLPQDTIIIKLNGSAGQSLGAFLASGITIELEGDANDYVGKGLSGGKMIIYPPKDSIFESHKNIIVGNVCLYGATGGQAFFSGITAERFAVRNSGATAVVEGVGDHGCEYMTGGRVVILGEVGRNFAAGMSGGIAYVLEKRKDFETKCNFESVELFDVVSTDDFAFLKNIITMHYNYTNSKIAKEIIDNFGVYSTKFIKVYPTEYRKAVEKETNVDKYPLIETEKSKIDDHLESEILDIEDSGIEEAVLEKRLNAIDKIKGFVKYNRKTDHYRPSDHRIKDWKEVNYRLKPSELKVQAARCMDCGVPFCQSNSGCPIGNIIPKWNDLVFKNQWKDALDRLMMTNNFPEFTGRVCPAPCEGACVLGINSKPVSIKSIECAIIDHAFSKGWIFPRPPEKRTGAKVAIIGSGPAGLAAADQLNKAGHKVYVYDRNDRAGGLLVYGIPNMKLDKTIVKRRVDLLQAEGIEFILNKEIGKDIEFSDIYEQYNAILIAAGATWPRDLNLPNRDSNGIHFAMEFLQKNTESLLNSEFKDKKYIDVKDKDVVVIGGGDTGCDCIGTSIRHGAKSITNFELLPMQPLIRAEDNPWPQYPRLFKLDYGHEEVKKHSSKDPREYCVLSKEFTADQNGNVTGIVTTRVDWKKNKDGKWIMSEIPNSQQTFKADVVFLAMGFMGPETHLLNQAEIKLNNFKNIDAQDYSTSRSKVFAAGDCRRGQSLIVWAINEGRQAAREVDKYIMGHTYLPLCGGILEPVVHSETDRSTFNTML